MKKIAVIGKGSWGSALHAVLNLNGHSASLLGRSRGGADLDALNSLVIAVPSKEMRQLARELAKELRPADNLLVISTSKGVEPHTGKSMLAVLEEELHGRGGRFATLSGPSFAAEVANRLPTAVTVASVSEAVAEAAAAIFRNDRFRVYSSTDVIGVELCGVLKNIIALAAGISDGLGMGLNARAALLTRGLVEMSRYVVASGGELRTVNGLSGMGDLILTATGDLSRNRQVGLHLAKGEPLEKILAKLGHVAEAVSVAPTIAVQAEKLGVEMPICDEVAKILSGVTTPKEAIGNLLNRAPKKE
jgi:glycerol-3-phosphate dehydrogenase (NAD(P)+)